jgi:hypothetical protein
MFRDFLFAQGVEYDETVMEPFIDGFASSFFEYMTGEDLNIASRYGPGGLTTFYDFWRGDKDFNEILLGASGGIMLQTIDDAIPMLRAMRSEIFDYEGGIYNLTADDMVQPFRNISVVDNVIKLNDVYNLGIWASRNETNIMEMDLPQAWMAFITGLTPQEMEDAFAKGTATQDARSDHNNAVREVVKYYRRAMQMEPGPERESAMRQIKAIMTIKGFTPRQRLNAWKRAANREMLTDIFFERYDKEVQRRFERIERAKD